MLSKAHAIKNKEFAKVKSRLDAETMNSAQVDQACVEHSFCVELCLFFCFVFLVLFTLSGVSKTWLFVVPFLFKFVLILFVFLFVGCTLSAMDFVCIMSAYHCCVRIQVGFQCFAIFVCVCIMCLY